MPGELTKRYESENDVKQELKIDSFCNMSEENYGQFALELPYMKPEVAKAIIGQFPVFAEFGKVAISTYAQICDSILKSNEESQVATIHNYQTILEALSKKMETEEDWEPIVEKMMEVAEKIEEVDIRNKEFLDKMSTKPQQAFGGLVGLAGFAAGAVVGAAIGIYSSYSRNEELPQLADDDNENIE